MSSRPLLLVAAVLATTTAPVRAQDEPDRNKVVARARVHFGRVMRNAQAMRARWESLYVGRGLVGGTLGGPGRADTPLALEQILAPAVETERLARACLTLIESVLASGEALPRLTLENVFVPGNVPEILKLEWAMRCADVHYAVQLLQREYDAGIAALWPADSKAYAEASADYAKDHDAARFHARIVAAREEMAAGEIKLRADIIPRYERLAAEIVDQRRRLCREAWAWSSILGLDRGEATRHAIYRIFEWHLASRDRDLHVRLFGSYTGAHSALDTFAYFSDSGDRLLLAPAALKSDDRRRDMDDGFAAERVEAFDKSAPPLDERETMLEVGELSIDNGSLRRSKFALTDRINALRNDESSLRKLLAVAQADGIAALATIARVDTAAKAGRVEVERDAAALHTLEAGVPVGFERDAARRAKLVAELERLRDPSAQSSDPETILATARAEEEKERLIAEIEARLDVARRADPAVRSEMDNLRARIAELGPKLADIERAALHSRTDADLVAVRGARLTREIAVITAEIARLETERAAAIADEASASRLPTVVERIEVASGGEVVFRARTWTPALTLAELDTWLVGVAEIRARSRAAFDSAMNDFIESTREAQRAGNDLHVVMMRAGVFTALVKTADALYESYRTARAFGPYAPAAFVITAAYQCAKEWAEMRTTQSLPSVDAGSRQEALVKEYGLLVTDAFSRNELTKTTAGLLVDTAHDVGAQQLGKAVLQRLGENALKTERALALLSSAEREALSGVTSLLELRLGYTKTLEAKLRAARASSSLTKDILFSVAKEVVKQSLIKASETYEHRAFYRFFEKDVVARAHFPVVQMARRTYEDAVDWEAGLRDARADLVARFRPEGYEQQLSTRFEKGNDLVIALTLSNPSFDIALDLEIGGAKARRIAPGRYAVNARDAQAGADGKVTVVVKPIPSR